MFSAEYFTEIKAAFDRQMALLDERIRQLKENPAAGLKTLSSRLLSEKKEEIAAAISRCTKEETQALTFLYSAMPLSDLLDYPASLSSPMRSTAYSCGIRDPSRAGFRRSFLPIMCFTTG